MYKMQFRYYKQKSSTPCFKDVLNFQNTIDILDKVTTIRPSMEIDENYSHLGLTHPSNWKMYELKSHKGLIVICNPFKAVGQRYWIARCLSDYTRKPNKLNLDAHDMLENTENWWVSSNCGKEESLDLRDKLRWATLGFHHNWDTKVYSDDLRDEFPSDLAEICSLIIKIILNDDKYEAQAAIVNFYHMNSNLSGHTDHSEPNVNAPLISFSFGQTAVFLIGGKQVEETPIAMYLHSGDIVIMSGESRLRYHGVPRIINCPNEPWNNIFYRNNYKNHSDNGYNNYDNREDVNFKSQFREINCSTENDINKHNNNFSARFDVQGDESETNNLNKILVNNIDEELTDKKPQNHDENTIILKNNSRGLLVNVQEEKYRNNVSMSECSDEIFWKPFDDYIKTARININVRQVLFYGQSSLEN